MNKLIYIILIIIGIIAAGIVIQPAAEPIKQSPAYNSLIDPALQNNTAAHEIAALGLQVTYEELGQDKNNYTVNGQTQFYLYNDGTEENFKVTLDDDIDPNSYTAYAVLYHELGHIVNVGDNDTEANADAYAASKGYQITDAYHGLH